MTQSTPDLSLKIATRCSPLALWQSEWVKAALLKRYPQLSVTLLPLKTQGDLILDTTLSKIGGKGLFLKELEQAIKEGVADIAVHSMKDVPAAMPAGFEIAAILPRHTPEDALVSLTFDSLDALPHGARIGTSSLRRQSQLLAIRPDLTISPIRGNVQTRLEKLKNGPLDATLLACAGLERLALDHHITQKLATSVCLPAVGQGAIGIECLASRVDLLALLAPLNDPSTATALAAERAFSLSLGGSCQSPIAGFAISTDDSNLSLSGLVASKEGRACLKNTQHASVKPLDLVSARTLGEQVADALLSQGAKAILDDCQE